MISAAAKRLALAGLTGLAACAPAPPAATTAALPPGEARVWFVRELEPGLGQASPNVYADGVSLGILPQSSKFYRDLAPGPHVFDVDKCIASLRSGQTLTLAAGDEAVLQVTALQNAAGWNCVPPDAYYLSPVLPQQRSFYLARLTDLGAR